MNSFAPRSPEELRNMAEAQLRGRLDPSGGLNESELRQRLNELEIQLIVSQLQRDEDKLVQQKSAERLRLAVRAANVGLWDWDLTTNRVTYSSEWKSQLGYTDGEIADDFNEWQCRVHPDDLPGTLEKVERYLAHPVGAHEVEFRMRHKDGSWRWIYARGEMISDETGKPLRMLGCHVDITSRKKLEDATRISEERLRKIVDSGMIGIVHWDQSGEITQANDAFLRLVGYTQEDVANRRVSWSHMTPVEFKPLDEQALQEILRTGTCLPFEKEYFHKDGSRIPILVGGAIFSGTPTQGVAFILDISRRKLAEKQLQVSDQALKAVSQGVIITDSRQNITSANQAFVALTGYSEKELLGQNCRLLQGPLSDRKKVEEIREALAHGLPFAGEVINHRKDGSAFANELTISPVRDARGNLTHFIGVTRDITARKQAERTLLESREQLRALLARLQRMREEERLRVSREIHDELGQLLTGLKMDVRWLERKLSAPGLPLTLNPLLDRAVAASELADMTIAAVQKIATELRAGALDQLGLAPAISSELRRLQERCGLLSSAQLMDPIPGLTATIAAELFNICKEALTNVVRHGRATQVDIVLRKADRDLVLEIADDGVGMAEAELTASGSLGLLGMRERAEQCGGTINFSRKEPHGLMVTIRVPIESNDSARLAVENGANNPPYASP